MILFIDTHTELITIALKTKENLFIKTKESEYSHSIYTMPMIEEIFKENNLNVKDLEEIVVVNGPGSFTGIRIGLSIAKTIAYALNLKIHTISSLKAYLISSDIKEDQDQKIGHMQIDGKNYCTIENVTVFSKNTNKIEITDDRTSGDLVIEKRDYTIENDKIIEDKLKY